MDYLKSNFIMEEKIKIQEIPAIILKPKDFKGLMPTVVFYHGWSSDKNSQRLRGFILASVGYMVLIPDAVHHGERNPLNNYGIKEAEDYFWDTIFKNIEEFNILKNELVTKYSADPKRIALMGSSMGGFTAGGIFAHNKDLKTLIEFNGCCWWENFNNNANRPPNDKTIIIENKVKEIDPFNYLNLLKDRPILLLHGDSDSVVPVDSQRIFYNKLNPLNKDKEILKLIEYPGLNHFVTTNMMDESINWLGKYL